MPKCLNAKIAAIFARAKETRVKRSNNANNRSNPSNEFKDRTRKHDDDQTKSTRRYTPKVFGSNLVRQQRLRLT